MYSIVFSAVNRLRPIIIITFGTTNVVVHNGICFGAGTGVGYRRPRYYYCGAVLRYWVHLAPYPNDSVTNGNRPQNIVSH